jgi:hypothetical protein
MEQKLTGAQIRQAFIDFFEEHRHTFVRSASLVPDDQHRHSPTPAAVQDALTTNARTTRVNCEVHAVAGKPDWKKWLRRRTTFLRCWQLVFSDYYKKEAMPGPATADRCVEAAKTNYGLRVSR